MNSALEEYQNNKKMVYQRLYQHNKDNDKVLVTIKSNPNFHQFKKEYGDS